MDTVVSKWKWELDNLIYKLKTNIKNYTNNVTHNFFQFCDNDNCFFFKVSLKNDEIYENSF